MYDWGFPGGSEVKASAWNAGDLGSIPGSGRSPGEGNANPLQYSCLENPMEGGAWGSKELDTSKRLHFTHFTCMIMFKEYTFSPRNSGFTLKRVSVLISLEF